MKRVAILQSNYIPWKGYFDLINKVDVFVFHDDLQYTSQDWRNRNRIKTANGGQWLTIPCGSSENRHICDVHLTDSSWQLEHWRIISQHYSSAPYFALYKDFFASFYLDRKWENLSDFNQSMIKSIAVDLLKIDTVFDDSRRYNLQNRKGDRVIELLRKTGASHYLSGPAARNYLREEDFAHNNIELEYMDYSGYPVYNQFFPPFEHTVSILDLLFHTGEKAREYCFRTGS